MIDDDLLNDITRLVKDDKRRKKKLQKHNTTTQFKEEKASRAGEGCSVESNHIVDRFCKLFAKKSKKNKDHPPIPTMITIRHDCNNDDESTYSLDSMKPKTTKLGETSSSSSSIESGDSSSSSGESSINSEAQYSAATDDDEEEMSNELLRIEIGRNQQQQQQSPKGVITSSNSREQKHSRIILQQPPPPPKQQQGKQRLNKFKRIFQKKKPNRWNNNFETQSF